MNEAEVRQRFDHAITTCLSGIAPDPFLYQRVLLRKDRPIMKRKITIVTIALAMMIMVCTTALAIGIYEAIKPTMDKTAEILVGSNWNMSDKLRFISIMQEYGLIDEQDPNWGICMNDNENAVQRDLAASLVIDSVYGELIRADRDPSILQPEEYPTPSLEDVFTVFYRSQVPDADDNTIAAEYEL